MRYLLVCALAGLALVLPAQAVAAPGCTVLQVLTRGGTSTVYRVRLPGAADSLGIVPYRVDAIGYAREQDLIYGIAGGSRARVVTLDQAGRATDLGPARGIPAGATAGAIAGDRWYLRAGDRLYTVDIDPGSRRYLRVLAVHALSPDRFAGVADFAALGGRLYGIVVSGKGDVFTVGIDPGSGRITPRPGQQFPEPGSGRITPRPGLQFPESPAPAAYRAAHGAVREVATEPGTARTDAAGCLAAPGPDVPPVPRLPGAPDRMPPAARFAPPVSAESPHPPLPGQPLRPAEPRIHAQEQHLAEQQKQDATAVKRRWSLTLLLLIIGAAAVHRGR